MVPAGLVSRGIMRTRLLGWKRLSSMGLLRSSLR
jgi:hypothetical protein